MYSLLFALKLLYVSPLNPKSTFMCVYGQSSHKSNSVILKYFWDYLYIENTITSAIKENLIMRYMFTVPPPSYMRFGFFICDFVYFVWNWTSHFKMMNVFLNNNDKYLWKKVYIFLIVWLVLCIVCVVYQRRNE